MQAFLQACSCNFECCELMFENFRPPWTTCVKTPILRGISTPLQQPAMLKGKRLCCVSGEETSQPRARTECGHKRVNGEWSPMRRLKLCSLCASACDHTWIHHTWTAWRYGMLKTRDMVSNASEYHLRPRPTTMYCRLEKLFAP